VKLILRTTVPESSWQRDSKMVSSDSGMQLQTKSSFITQSRCRKNVAHRQYMSTGSISRQRTSAQNRNCVLTTFVATPSFPFLKVPFDIESLTPCGKSDQLVVHFILAKIMIFHRKLRFALLVSKQSGILENFKRSISWSLYIVT
jgi:hypothetical protein